MSRLGALRGEAGGVRQQLAAVTSLHADLRLQQPTVDALADCVIVVDEHDTSEYIHDKTCSGSVAG